MLLRHAGAVDADRSRQERYLIRGQTGGCAAWWNLEAARGLLRHYLCATTLLQVIHTPLSLLDP